MLLSFLRRQDNRLKDWIPDPASPVGFQASHGYAPTSAAASTGLDTKEGKG